MFSYLKRLVANGWIIFRTRLGVSLLATLTVFLVSLSLWSALAVNFAIDRGLAYAQAKLDFSIYFKTDADRNDITKLQAILETFPKVDRVTLVGKEQAFAQFQTESGKNPVLGAALRELKINPLTDYLVVRANEPQVYAEVASYLESSPYRSIIEFFTYAENQRVIKRFIVLSQRVRLVVAGLIAAVAAFGAMVMFNAIVLTIYAQREEIEILRLIGASGLFIRAPFLIFATIVTVLGCVLGTAVFIITLHQLSPIIAAALPEGNLERHLAERFLSLGLALGAFLLAVNTASTWISLQRYLKA